MSDLETAPFHVSSDISVRSLINEVRVNEDTTDDVKVLYLDQHDPKAGLLSSIFNLVNAAVGAGVLAFPFAFARAGLVAGLAITAILAILSALTLLIIAIAANHTNSYTYQESISKLFGRKVAYIIELILIFYLIGACISFLVVVGEIASPPLMYWTRNHCLASPRAIMSIVCIIIILPLAFFHKLKWLGFTSFLSIFSVAYTVSFVSIRGIMHLYTVGIGKDVKILVNPSWEFFVTLPLFCFAFQCHIHASPIYYELKNKSLKKMSFIIVTSMFICFMIYSLVGVFGYLTFGNKIKGNIMGYYDLKDVFVTIGLLCIGVTVVLSYPIHSLTARQAIESLIFPEGLHGIYYVIITLAIVFGSLGFALVIPGILQIFGLMGSIGSVSLMFIFPGLILWKLGDRWFWRILSVVLIIFGIAMGISGTAFTIMEMIIK